MFFLYLACIRNSFSSFFELIAPLFEKSLCAILWFSRSILSFSLFLRERFRLPCFAPEAVVVDIPLMLASKVLAFFCKEVGRFGNMELCFPWLISTSLFNKTWLFLFKSICCSAIGFEVEVTYLIVGKSYCESCGRSSTPSFDSFPSPDSIIESFLCVWSLSSVVCDSYTRCIYVKRAVLTAAKRSSRQYYLERA